MKILVLTKRQYTAHDLLDDRFGRVRELPLALARKGHHVRGICLSYARRPEGLVVDKDESTCAEVMWDSLNAGLFRVPGVARFFTHAYRLIRKFKPDIIWACSDSIYAIIGIVLARLTGTRVVVDLYDNFESFALATHVPGLMPLFRSAIRGADGVTCVSDALRERVHSAYHRNGWTITLCNGARTDVFRPADKDECRRVFALPEHARLVGTAGALFRNRGVHALYEAFAHLARHDPDLHLVVAGHRDLSPPTHARIHDFGVLSQADASKLVCALDVAVICNLDSPFGRYCFPQKAYEFLACRVPIVAARTAAVVELFRNDLDAMFTPGDSFDLVRALRRQIENPVVLDVPIPTWDDLSGILEKFFIGVLSVK